MKKGIVNDLCKNNNITLGSIESFTGGSFASYITSIPGASSFFKGSVVTYFTSEKVSLVGISEDSIKNYGVVSAQIAEEMAVKGREKLNVDICVSFTGNAGPSALENKSVGEIYIGVAYKDNVIVQKYNLHGSRNSIRKRAIFLAKTLICNVILKNYDKK